MDILILSNDDVCRSRIAEELLSSYGRGMKIYTAGIVEGNFVPEIVCKVMDENGYNMTRRKPTNVETYANRHWDFVITLCEEAEKEFSNLHLNSKYHAHFDFEDPFKGRTSDEQDTEDKIIKLYEAMNHELYRLYRDTISDLVMPTCTCGANTYCRCQ